MIMPLDTRRCYRVFGQESQGIQGRENAIFVQSLCAKVGSMLPDPVPSARRADLSCIRRRKVDCL